MQKIIFVSNSITAMYKFRRELIEKLAKSNKVILISIANEEKKYFFENVKNIYLGKSSSLYHSITLLYVWIKLSIYICRNVRSSDIIFSFSPTVNLMLGILLRFKLEKPRWFPTFAGLGSISLMCVFPLYRILFTKFR